MKAKIHPKLNHVIFVDITNNSEYPTTSTLSSKETKTVNGIEYSVIRVETSSSSHPFYTGTQKSTSKGNQVAKFMEKMQKAQAAAQPKPAKTEEEKADAPKAKKAKK